MRYHILATDFDGTLAQNGSVDSDTIAALERLRSSGRQLILVTGRILADLKTIFSRFDLFEWVVAENGAELYRPSNQETILLGGPPSSKFIQELQKRGVEHISIGECIVATFEPYENIVLATIRDLGLELKVTFNKGAIMVLPPEINKATGIMAVLKKMGLSPHEMVGVGDAANDHAFLSICECSAAVANALPAIKEQVDILLTNDHGQGVVELIEAIVKDDLQSIESQISRHQLLLGARSDGVQMCIKPYNNALLIAGASGSGKSTLATGLLERLSDEGYQYCIIDPEGDFATIEGAIVIGSANYPPAVDEVMQVLKNQQMHVCANMIGVPLADRPDYFLKLLARLIEFRTAVGRPHWILIDEAHHLLPASGERIGVALPQELNRVILVTVHPEAIAPDVLALVQLVIAVGPEPQEVLGEFSKALGQEAPSIDFPEQTKQEVVVWLSKAREARLLYPAPCRSERRRHIQKYMSGEVPANQSFYFQGPEGKLNIRAQNLMLFMQIGDGVDDDTWQHHFKNGDFTKWFDEGIKDHELAKEAKALPLTLPANESRQRIRQLIELRYTLPATSYLPLPGTAAEPKE